MVVKVVGMRIVELDVPIDPPYLAAWDPEPRTSARHNVVFVETDEGVTGVSGGDLAGFDGYVRHFIGTDPTLLAEQSARVKSCAFHGGRFWPVEAAMWDIAGKSSDRSVAELVGGLGTRVRTYASASTRRDPGEWADVVAERRADGFGALKLRLDVRRPEHAIESVTVAREAGGADFAIMVDLNQAWRMAGDITVSATVDEVLAVVGPFAELGVVWLEEPLPLHDIDGLRRLALEAGAMRLAGGEMVETANEAWHLLQEAALGVYQPDSMLTMGLHELSRFGRACLQRGAWYTPHTWGDGFALLVNLHLTCGLNAGPWFEYPYDPPGWRPAVRDVVFREPIEPDDQGWLTAPTGPGLGVDLDLDRISDLTVTERTLA